MINGTVNKLEQCKLLATYLPLELFNLFFIKLLIGVLYWMPNMSRAPAFGGNDVNTQRSSDDLSPDHA